MGMIMFGGRCDSKLFDKLTQWSTNRYPKVLKSPHLFNFAFKLTIDVLENIAEPLEDLGIDPLPNAEKIHHRIVMVAKEVLMNHVDVKDMIENLVEETANAVKVELKNK